LIKQYVKLFELDGIELSFEEETLEYIVDKAMEFNLGARGLRSICENIMIDAMYDSPSEGVKSLCVTPHYAASKFDLEDHHRLKAS